jgi:DEAD/DEAH box helicase domain-containing protein
VLPMFGFPSRVRPLYGGRIRSRDDLEKQSVTDRSLDMAISAFSPGAQVVREGWLHSSVGFAAYEVKGSKALAKDPIGPQIALSRCLECGTIGLAARQLDDVCEVCSSPLQPVPLHQPLGFRTDYVPRGRGFDHGSRS